MDFLKNNPSKTDLAIGLLKALGIVSRKLLKTATGFNLISKSLPRLVNNQKIISLLRGLEKKPGSAKVILVEMNREIKKELQKEATP